jgi:hypothetical protein
MLEATVFGVMTCENEGKGHETVEPYAHTGPLGMLAVFAALVARYIWHGGVIRIRIGSLEVMVRRRLR